MTYPSFASGDVLNASDMNAVGLWLVKTQTIGSAVSSVTVTGAFSSTYDNYLIQVAGGVASGSSAIGLTLGSTATGYYMAGYSVTYAGVGSVGNDNNATKWTYAGVGTTDSINVNLILNGPNLAKRTYAYVNYVFGNPAGGGDGAAYQGYLNNATQYTAFTLTPSSGTLTGGTIRVYGYRN